MKKQILFLTTVVAAFVLFFACSKDQKVVKQLDGTWRVTAMTEDGVSVPSSEFEDWRYTFSTCKVKKEECDGTLSDGTFTLPFKYKITDKGTKFTMTFNFLGTNETESGSINEHSKSKFVFTSTEDGHTTVTTLEK